MKYMFASDLHGSYYYGKKLLEEFEKSGAEKLITLGDILYHGPRNNLPDEYDTRKLYPLLNEYKDRIYAIKGNCDSEVDQMVLEFPCLNEAGLLELNGITFYLSHGHVYSPENLPPMRPKEVFVFGHIHVPVAEKKEYNGSYVYILNPGSASLPKTGNPHTYAILDGKVFTIYDFDGNKVKEIVLE